MSEYCFAQGTIIIEEDVKMIHKVNIRDRWGESFAEASQGEAGTEGGKMKCLNPQCKYNKLESYDCTCPECGTDNYYLWIRKILKEGK